MQSTVARLIRRYGKLVAIRRPAGSTGWTKSWVAEEGRYKWVNGPTTVYVDPASAPTDVEGYAIEKKYRQNEINGTTVMAGDRRFLSIDIPAPTTADRFIVGTMDLTIVSINAVQPGDTTLVYELQCRGT
jgi:hypothetical protein